MPHQHGDSGGTQITVGATVKLVGTVASINQSDTRYNTITVTLSHPKDNTVVTVVVPADCLTVGS